MDRYDYLNNSLKGERAPFAFVDMNFLDKNIEDIKLRAGSKQIRIATKSIRSLEMLRYIERKLGSKANGFMCFSVEEACWLSEQGLDNLLVAYPSMDKKSIIEVSKLNANGKKIYLMIDSLEQVNFLEDLTLEGPLFLCIDIDLSTYLPGLNFGVFRSPTRTKSQVLALLNSIKGNKGLQLKALMGYEAQIAGVTDNQKGRSLMNLIIGLLKKISLKRIPSLRASLVKSILDQGIELDFVNGGGTGSMESTREEDSVSEIAVGSGFYAPTLFDSYSQFKHLPAAGFALEVVRIPEKNIYTCFSGGYVASGAIGRDKVPSPYLPEGSELTNNEMAGEVQTPVLYRGQTRLGLGSRIYFRHAKAGELCERFLSLLLIRDGAIEKSVDTYRGSGKLFG